MFLFSKKILNDIAGSFSRSAVNYNAGAQTTVSNIIMSTTVLITLLFLMPLFHYTPNVILGAIIITAVIGLIDYEAAFRLWKVDKLDFVTCLCSFFGVLFISVPLGLAIAVSFFLVKQLFSVRYGEMFVIKEWGNRVQLLEMVQLYIKFSVKTSGWSFGF